MQIEIVEFYPFKKNNELQILIGTLHVYIIDLGIDIRGIFVKREKDKWWFNMPFKIAYDEETNKPIRYPIISFTDQKKNTSFRNEVMSKGKEYITKNFDFSTPLSEPAIH